MNTTQKLSTVFFFFIVLFFASGARTVFALEQGSWDIDDSGIVTAIAPPAGFTFSGSYIYRWLATTTDHTSHCPMGGAGSGSDFDPNNFLTISVFSNGGLGQTDCTSPGDYYLTVGPASGDPTVFWRLNYDGVHAQPINATTSTRIISVFPLNNSIVASTTDFTSYFFVSSSDLDKLDTLFSSPAEKVTVTAKIYALNGSLNTKEGWLMYEYPLPTGHETSTSTTAQTSIYCNVRGCPFEDDTDYRMEVRMTGSNYFGIFGSVFDISTTTYFTIGSTIYGGQLSQAIASSSLRFDLNRNSLFGAINEVCSPITVSTTTFLGISYNTGFDVLACVGVAILPPQSILDTDINEFRTRFATIAPIGYLTRFIDILNASTTASTTLPTIAYTFGSTSPLGISTIEFDPFSTLDDPDNPLYYTSDQAESKTVAEIFETPINIVIYLTLFLLIIREITSLNLSDVEDPKVVTVYRRGATRPEQFVRELRHKK